MTLEILAEEIFVYHNFLTQEELDNILYELSQQPASRFRETNPGAQQSMIGLNSAMLITNKLQTILSPDLQIKQHNAVIKMNEGQFWGEHADDEQYQELLHSPIMSDQQLQYEEQLYPLYGVVVYLNNFTGGEIEYPLHNITYAPQPGDMVIHSAKNSCRHLVRPVIQGPRYSYSNAIYKTILVPIVQTKE